MKCLTGVYAHPDDETFSGGGTYAKYAAAGVRCTVYCATDGDAGKTSGVAVRSKADLAVLRREELDVARKILGIAAIELPGHPDGGLIAENADRIVGEIVRHFRRERPQVVITFGPEGAPNTHPDHRVISRCATAAFLLAGNDTIFVEQLEAGLEPHAPSRLYYVTWPKPGAEALLKTRGLPATACIDVRNFREVERRAWAAHRTQQLLQQRFDETAAADDELFAYAMGVAQPSPLVDDLFAGL
ncbi:MAG TPA: PIG-L family deacetylase [Candidatus Limnocylindrales bacterium]|nr:PIG-L family deacetylase [Candidatus Limnocylindrales bacterium]